MDNWVQKVGESLNLQHLPQNKSKVHQIISSVKYELFYAWLNVPQFFTALLLNSSPSEQRKE